MSESFYEWMNLLAGNIWLYGGAFILVLSILVFVHEWGHYIVARMCGVRVESFSIGFGREIFGFTDKKQTRWKFSLIPLGGYVKMFGDVDPASAHHEETIKDKDTDEIRRLNDEELKVAFYSQSVLKRTFIVFAGPAINFLFAIVLMMGLFSIYGQPVTPPVAAAVIGDSAAHKAGFLPHDEILAIDGKTMRRFEDIRREVMVALDKEQVFTIRRDGEVIDIVATPDRHKETDRFGFSHSRGLLGLISPGSAVFIDDVLSVAGIATETPEEARNQIVSRFGETFDVVIKRSEDEKDTLWIQPQREYNGDFLNPDSEGYKYLIVEGEAEEILVKYTLYESFVESLRETAEVTVSTMEALWQMISGTRSATELGGIIRIGAIAGDMAKSGWVALISFTALLSINLGLINLFPIPMLDGGHLVFYAVEAVKGSPISEQIQEYAFRVGLVILVGVMLFANLNDIIQLIPG